MRDDNPMYFHTGKLGSREEEAAFGPGVLPCPAQPLPQLVILT